MKSLKKAGDSFEIVREFEGVLEVSHELRNSFFQFVCYKLTC